MEPRRPPALADQELGVRMGEIRRADPLRVHNFYGMNDRLDLSAPMIKECGEAGKTGRGIKALEHEALQNAPMIRHVIKYFSRQQRFPTEFCGKV